MHAYINIAQPLLALPIPATCTAACPCSSTVQQSWGTMTVLVSLLAQRHARLHASVREGRAQEVFVGITLDVLEDVAWQHAAMLLLQRWTQFVSC